MPCAAKWIWSFQNEVELLSALDACTKRPLPQPPSRCNALRGGTKVLHAVPAANARPFGTPEFFLVRLTQSIPSAGILLSSRTFVGEKEAWITNPLELDNVIWQKPPVDRLQIIHALLLHDVRIHLKRSHQLPRRQQSTPNMFLRPFGSRHISPTLERQPSLLFDHYFPSAPLPSCTVPSGISI
jgi:hypothetical protein